jgi:hypothetical protein
MQPAAIRLEIQAPLRAYFSGAGPIVLDPAVSSTTGQTDRHGMTG